MLQELEKSRAWIEVNLDNLKYNIMEIKQAISKYTKIIAVVKANAYGHGLVEVSKYLNDIGIYDFAVATLEEGITLRKNGIVGNILIFGYTDISLMKYVIEYDLIQTVVDEDYAKKLMDSCYRVKVHIKINTGMNRNGISYQNISLIKEIYKNETLDVLGIYTHLCAVDSLLEEDVVFTKLQIKRYFDIIDILKKKNINVGSTHIQSSYGLLHYPEVICDYVRIGSLMYGTHNKLVENPKLKLDLKPVLTVKARITSVKTIEKGETVGYGRIFRAEKKLKIATASIGFADGYPRNLSGKNVPVIINGKKAIVIGRICMDILMIDIKDIEGKVGDIVTLIGDKVTADLVADFARSASYELLCRLGTRLHRIYKYEKITE